MIYRRPLYCYSFGEFLLACPSPCYRLAVVHDAPIVVLYVHVPDDAPRVLLEVVVQVAGDVAPDDLNVAISVGSRLLVVEAQGVADLVDNDAFLR